MGVDRKRPLDFGATVIQIFCCHFLQSPYFDDSKNKYMIKERQKSNLYYDMKYHKL